jgi:5'-nucleotidase
VNAITLTGADIKQVLEQQFIPRPPRSRLILGTSEGFSCSYDLSRPVGDQVLADSITLDGVTIDPQARYRVVANSFLIAGGDQFAAFTKGTDPVTGPVDAYTAVAYFQAHSPVSLPPADHSHQIG